MNLIYSFAGEIPLGIERLVLAQSISIAPGETRSGGGHRTDHHAGESIGDAKK